MSAILPGKKSAKGSNEPFSFVTSLTRETDDGQEPIVITVPSLATVKLNEFKMQLLREKSPIAAAGYGLRCSLGDAKSSEVLELLAELDPDEATRFSEEWREHSGVSQGESSAS